MEKILKLCSKLHFHPQKEKDLFSYAERIIKEISSFFSLPFMFLNLPELSVSSCEGMDKKECERIWKEEILFLLPPFQREGCTILDESSLPPPLQKQGIKYLIISPLFKGEEGWGFIGGGGVTKLEEDKKTLFILLSNYVGRCLENFLHWEELLSLRQRYHKLFEEASDIIVVINEEGKIVEANRSIEEIGYRKEEILGRKFYELDFLTPETLKKVLPLFHTFRKGKALYKNVLELEGRDKRGRIVPFEVKASLISLKEGDYVLAVLRDLSERKRLESALKEKELLYRTLVNEALIGVYLLEEGVIKFVNSEMGKMFGYEVEEMMGKPYHIFVHPSQLKKMEEMFNKELQNLGMITHFFTQAKRKDGEVIDVEIRSSSLILGGKRVILGVVRDVSEEKRLKEELIQASRLTTLGEIFAGMAHEISNPLSGLLGYLDMVIEKVKGSKEKEYLKKAREMGVKISRLVKDTLRFSRKHPLQKQKVEIAEVIKKVISWREKQMVEEGIQLEVDVSSTLPSFEFDPDQIAQVLLNLILNAEDAVRDKKGEKKVGVKAYFHENQIHLEISDNGKGIPPEVGNRIFDPFFTTKSEGTGLGLSVSYRIIKDHGGKISYSSKVGEGTTFKIQIPVEVRNE